MTTCLGLDIPVPKIHEDYLSNPRNSTWSLRIYFPTIWVPSDEKNPAVVSFDANRDLDEDGNVEFIPILPRTEKAKAKYNDAF